MTAVATRPPEQQRAPITRTVARHSGVVVAQVAAGLGNLAFSIVAFHLLDARPYAQFSAFLAAYLLINTPAASLTAGASLRPELVRKLRTPMLWIGLGVGVTLAVAAPALSGPSGLPVPLLLLLAADAPVAGVLAVVRGGLFGQQRLFAAAAGMVSEPVARCAFGLALVPVAGLTGAATGVIIGSYVSLALCLLLNRRRSVAAAELTTARATAPATALAFLFFTVVGAEDVIVGNRVLPPTDAGVFAAVSTLGGAVLFATSTVPLVVLAQLRDRAKHSLPIALLVTFVTSAFATAVLVLLPRDILQRVLGHDAGRVATVLPTYLAAMVLLCLGRVLLASLCARGRACGAVVGGVLAVAVQLVLLVRAGSAMQAATATLAAGGVLLVVMAALALLPTRAEITDPPLVPDTLGPAGTTFPVADEEIVDPTAARPRRADRHLDADRWRRTDTSWVVALAVLAAIVRLSTDRSVWIDEAISVHEASQPYGRMLSMLQSSDVHPPLYFTLLWGVIHATGSTAEMVVRIPSIVPGVVLVLVAYAAAKDVWDRRTARFAGAIAVVGPAAVWYSQDARMYALFMLFSVLSTWTAVRLLRDGKWSDALWLTLSSAALLWTQYDTAFVVATVFLGLLGTALLRVGRKQGWKLLLQTLLAGIVTAASFLPLVPWVLQQYGHTTGLTASIPSQATSGSTSNAVNAYSALTDGVWAAFGYHSDAAMLLLNAFWPVLLLLVLASLGRGSSNAARMFTAVAVVPAAVLFALGQRRSNMFDLRYFSATVPMVNLLLARLAASWPKGRFTRIAVPTVLCAALLAGLVDEQANRSNPRVYDFRDAVHWVSEHSQPGDSLVYGPSYLTAELEYYQPGIKVESIGTTIATGTSKHVFVLGSFLDQKAVAGQVGGELSSLQRSRHLVHKVTFPNVTVWEYSS